MTLLAVAPPAVEPAHLTLPEGRPGAGREAVELAASAGLLLDGWQQVALERALLEREDGRWAATQVGIVVPRQNGKGAILEARELAGLFLFGESLITHTAHEFKTAMEAFRRLWGLVENTADLRRMVRKKLENNNGWTIELTTRQRIVFVARSKGSGRGFTGDTVIFDEAYDLPEAVTAALVPTMSARPNPQVWFTSSAPRPEVNSDTLRKLCKRGREGSGRLAYMEWCAADSAPTGDRSAWGDANPGLGAGRLNAEFIEETEFGILGADDFARERLGIWHESDRISPFGHGNWEACADANAQRPGSVRLAFDLTPKSTSASIGVAGRVGAKWFGDVAVHGEGTDWLIDELVRLWRELEPDYPVVYDEKAPAQSMAAKVEAAGVPVEPLNTVQHQEACGALFLDVVEGRFVHPDRPELNAAVFGAEQRDVGDAWLWSRRKSDCDISPLVAVGLARFAATLPPAKRVLTEASVW